MTKTIEGSLDGRGLRIALVVSRFNEHVTRRLLEGALAALAGLGLCGEDMPVAWVPGAFEIPGAGAKLLEKAGIDAVIGLGCVIRGETPHFELVARAAAEGTLRVGLDHGKPFIFGVLAVENEAQALARAEDGPGNKGREAALTAVECVRLHRAIGDQAG